MGHDDRGGGGQHPAQRLLDQRLGVHVEGRQGVVEHQHVGAGQDRAGQRQALPLAARERHALLADAGVEAPGQVVDEAGLADLERLLDVGLAGVGAAQGEVLAGAHGEQGGVLEGGGDQAAQVLDAQLAHVDAVEEHPTGRDVPQPGHQRGQDRLARAGRADQGDRLARSHVEVDPAQHRLVGGVGEGEVHALEAQVAAGLGDLAIAAADRGLGVVDLEDPCRRGHRLLGHRQDHPQRGDRPDQAEHQGDEGDQLTDGELPAPDPDGAEQQHDHDGDVGDDLEEGPELRREPRLVDAGGVQAPGGDVVELADVAAAPEGLDHPDADRALLGQRRQVALLVLDLARDDDVALLEAHRQPHDRHGGGGHDQAQRPVHVQQHRGGGHELDDVDEQEEQAEAREPADRRQVGGRPREQLARAPAGVEGHRQALQVGVEVAPHRRLEPEHGVGLHPPAPEHQHRLEHAEQQRQAGQRQQRPQVAVGDRPVDDRPGHQRDADRQGDAAQGGHQHDRQRADVGAQVAAQAPQRVHAGGRRPVRVGTELVGAAGRSESG